MMLVRTCCLAVATMCYLTGTNAQPISVAAERQVIAIEAQDLYISRNVLKQFFKHEKNRECYLVSFSRFEGHLRVEFHPKSSNDDFSPPRLRENSCGRNVGFILDDQGRVIRKIYSR